MEALVNVWLRLRGGELNPAENFRSPLLAVERVISFMQICTVILVLS